MHLVNCPTQQRQGGRVGVQAQGCPPPGRAGHIRIKRADGGNQCIQIGQQAAGNGLVSLRIDEVELAAAVGEPGPPVIFGGRRIEPAAVPAAEMAFLHQDDLRLLAVGQRQGVGLLRPQLGRSKIGGQTNGHGRRLAELGLQVEGLALEQVASPH